MAAVYIGIGSNVDRNKNIQQAIKMLKEDFGNLVFSNVYESASVDFLGEPYYNLVLLFKTVLLPKQLIAKLKQIEQKLSRKRTKGESVICSIDLDLLLYDDFIDDSLNIPHNDICKKAFVLLPLSEINPMGSHPILTKNFADLWKDFPLQHYHLRHVTNIIL